MRIDSRETKADKEGPVTSLLQSLVIEAGKEIGSDLGWGEGRMHSRGGREKRLDSGSVEGKAGRTC